MNHEEQAFCKEKVYRCGWCHSGYTRNEGWIDEYYDKCKICKEDLTWQLDPEYVKTVERIHERARKRGERNYEKRKAKEELWNKRPVHRRAME